MNLTRRRTSRDDRTDQLIEWIATHYVTGTVVADHELAKDLGCSRGSLYQARLRAVAQGRLRTQSITGAGGGIGYELVATAVEAALDQLEVDVARIVAAAGEVA